MRFKQIIFKKNYFARKDNSLSGTLPPSSPPPPLPRCWHETPTALDSQPHVNTGGLAVMSM